MIRVVGHEITCDVCLKARLYVKNRPGRDATFWPLLAAAERKGWVHDAIKDWCPDCWKEKTLNAIAPPEG
jgi:hypothetical protein